MASKRVKTARPAPRCGAPAAARGGGRLGGTSDMPLDYETAVLNDLWGWWWASIAAETGASSAASYPLLPEDEVEALRYAKSIATGSSNGRVIARQSADHLANRAVEAFRASLPLLRTSREINPTPELLWCETDRAMRIAEPLCRAAAKAHRTLILLSREQGGVH